MILMNIKLILTYFYSHTVGLLIFMMDVTFLDPTVMDTVIHLLVCFGFQYITIAVKYFSLFLQFR